MTTDRFEKMKDNRLLGFGIVGTVVAALCCFTPVLVVLLGAVGLSAWLGWLDYVLFPALAIFATITVYAVARRTRRSAGTGTANEIGKDIR